MCKIKIKITEVHQSIRNESVSITICSKFVFFWGGGDQLGGHF